MDTNLLNDKLHIYRSSFNNDNYLVSGDKDNVGDFKKIERVFYDNNELFVSSFDYILAYLKNNPSFSNYNILESYISVVYYRELRENYDLIYCFFSKLEGFGNYLYFEIEINTGSKFISNSSPKIKRIYNYKVEEEFKQAISLKDFIASEIKTDEKYNNIEIKEVIFVKFIKGNLIASENFVMACSVLEDQHYLRKAIFTFSIESSTRMFYLANIEFKEKKEYFSDNQNEIILDIEVFEHLNLSLENFKLKETKKFLDNKSSDSLIEFIENNILASKVLKAYQLEKGLYINSVEKRENSSNNFDVILEFFKRTQSYEFLVFTVHINVDKKYYKIYRMKCFKLIKVVNYSIDDENLVTEALLTLENDYKLKSISSFNMLKSNDLPNNTVFSCLVTIESEERKVIEEGFLLIYKRNGNIATASAFVKYENKVNKGEVFNIFDITNYNHGNNNVILTDSIVFRESNDIQLSLHYIYMNNLVKDLSFNNDLNDLISYINLIYIAHNRTVLMTIIFLTVFKGTNFFLYQVELKCKKESNNNIVFNIIKVDKLRFYSLNKKLINEFMFQKVIEVFSHKRRWEALKSAIVTDILDHYGISKNNLILKDHFVVKFKYLNNKELKYGLITYSKKGNEIYPVCFYEMINDNEFIDYTIINVNKEIYDYPGEYLLDIKFNNVLSSFKNLEGTKYNIIIFPHSKLPFSITENYYDMIKSHLKEKFNSIEFQNSLVMNLFSIMKYYECGAQEIVSYLSFKLKYEEFIITELHLSVSDMLNKQFEIKSLCCFLLKSVEENDYPNYEVISNVLWSNTPNKEYENVIITKVKKCKGLKERSYFKNIYYIQFRKCSDESEYSFMYGLNEKDEAVMMKQVGMVIKNKNNIKNMK